MRSVNFETVSRSDPAFHGIKSIEPFYICTFHIGFVHAIQSIDLQ